MVIGGETEGISERAKKYAHENGGERLFIPLENGVDSLNVASAASMQYVYRLPMMSSKSVGVGAQYRHNEISFVGCWQEPQTRWWQMSHSFNVPGMVFRHG